MESYPPPTVNNLDRNQRMRLVRSNRKLEAVLGTAPLYIEPESPDMTCMTFDRPRSKARHREGRIFGHSPSSSLSASSSTSSLILEESYVVVDKSLKSSPRPVKPVAKPNQAPRALQLSRPLLLRLRSVPVPPSDLQAAQLSPPLPSISLRSPSSPTFTINLETLHATNLENRRKKMAKLTRTLGENVPPELVFPSNTTSPTEKPAMPRQPVRKPIPSSFTPPAPLSPHNSAKPPVISRPKAKSSTRRRPSVTVPPPTSLPAPHPRSQQPPKAPTLAERRRKPRPRSLSLSAGADMLAAAAQLRAEAEQAPRPMQDILVGRVVLPLVQKDASTVNRATRDVPGPRSPPPFQSTIPIPKAPVYQHRYARSSPSNINFEFDTAEQAPRGHQHTKSSPSPQKARSAVPFPPSAFSQYGKRKERGWSGEWNQDMGEVVSRLRGLKAR